MRLTTTFVSVSVFTAVLGFTLGDLSEHHADFMSLLFIALIVLSLMLSYLFARGYRIRMGDIEEAAILLAVGRLQHRIQIFNQQDEIDRLAIAFNRMSEILQQQVSQLQTLVAENQQLLKKAELAAADAERQRLARELHDSVSQQLFSLSLLAESALVEAKHDALKSLLQQMADLARQTQRELRSLLLHLRPLPLANQSLEEAAEQFLDSVSKRHHIQVHQSFHVHGSMPEWMEQELFRILQEAVSNALKHADATEIRVQCIEQEAAYTFSISDNGNGLPFLALNPIDESTKISADHYGLLSMQERAERMGGRIDWIEQQPGLTVQVTIPRLPKGDGAYDDKNLDC
ncbi:two-component system, NarL family, sensor histidine kinase LiaS [Alicyclobacillus tolerans]|uniref:histidine kinase n=1 Tax=Alicyclobacillus tolerans TaxID=90970 RepID=A0A1M6LXV8_9BACL|nr:two-component system, NarL family, sensor histidine kinase LiaS [Alicyclobacillus montanus]